MLKTSVFIFSLYFFASCNVVKSNEQYEDGAFRVTLNSRLRTSNASGVLLAMKMVGSQVECSMICQRKASCRSINVEKDKGQGTTRRCEVLSVSKKQRHDLIEESTTFDHLESIEPCKDSCFNGADCTITSPTTFKCVCAKGYQGVRCEADIDECSTNTHNCDREKGVCTNTKGSFTCKCKPLHYGDGMSCIGIPPTRGLEKSSILNYLTNYKYINNLVGYLNPYLRSLDASRWVVCWNTSTDGWNAVTKFHQQCDGKGPTVTIIRVAAYVFGGYSDVSWQTGTDYSFSNRSFLYSMYNINGYEPTKLNLNGLNNGGAVASGQGFQGPTFGGGYDLYISDMASNGNLSFTKPHTYDPPKGCTLYSYCSFFAGSDYFIPNQVEVFYEMI